VARVRRRTLLSAGASGLLAATAGCGAVGRLVGVGPFVRVAVSWSATELAAFRDVLAGHRNDDTEVIPLGDDIDAALGARTAGRPNMVALPQPGHVVGNVDNVVPMPPGVWRPEYNWIWPQPRPYALPFKIAHGSVVWYRRKLFGERGWSPPSTWDEWLALNREIAATGLAPLALGGADGWMLDSWFENILLRNHTRTYDDLTRAHSADLWGSDEVRETFTMLAEMWRAPGAVSGGPRRALLQQYPDAVMEVFRYGRAAMVLAPSFAEAVTRAFDVPDEEIDTFTFPGTTVNLDAPLAVAGDLLVLTQPASDESLELLRFLATPDAPLPWITGTGGFIAANPDTPTSGYSPTLARLARHLRAQGDNIRFDLSDQLGAVGGREGLQRALQDLLEQLGAGESTKSVVDNAVQKMVSVEG
jgi:alpha-glucoside transport system substrate-binding protein